MNKKKKYARVAVVMLLTILGVGLIVGKLTRKTEEDTVSKAEWLHELAQTFNTEDMSELPKNYFADLSEDSPYYEDAVWAVQKGLLRVQEGEKINLEEKVTREFAAHSLNNCLGIVLEDEELYTYLDVEEADYPEDIQIAINQGWLELNNGFFGAEEKVSPEEVDGMIKSAGAVVALSDIRKDYDNVYQFAENVIEVPEGRTVIFGREDDVITISGTNTGIEEGDCFVVYQSELPIVYMANAVSEENDTVIAVEKADASVYQYVDEQGIMALNEENCEFIPAKGVQMLSFTSKGLDLSDGLSLSVGVGESKSEIYLKNLTLSHSFSDNGFTVTVGGNWGMESKLSYTEDLADELPLGEFRIYGIGKVQLSFSLKKAMELKSNLNGSFRVGVSVLKDGTKRIIREFHTNTPTITGKGSITAALKISIGVDILAAMADVYGEIGVETQLTLEVHRDANDKAVSCQDFKYYLFLSVGAEVRYYAFWNGKMESIMSTEWKIFNDENSPFIFNIHWEDGLLTSRCAFGMKVPDLSYGGLKDIGSTGLSDDRKRVLETNLVLGYDVVIPGDLTIENNSNLNLGGHTLTVKGSLYQTEGVININGGILNVEGDYRIQSVEEDEDGNKVYGASPGYLYMGSGTMNIEGNFGLFGHSCG